MIISYPTSDKKTLPIGTTRVNVKSKQVTFPDGTMDEFYSSKPIKVAKCVLLYLNEQVDVKFYLEGDPVYVGTQFPTLDRMNLTFDLIEITTTTSTAKLVIQMSDEVDGVSSMADRSQIADVGTVGEDIDGNKALTTNSLGYGEESDGVTHPINASPADTARITDTIVQTVQHTDAGGKVQPAGDVVTNPINVAIGDGAQVIDVETIEADIDGKAAVTTNSLAYGKVSAGVTVPIHVNNEGDIVTVPTPGEILAPPVYTTASCAAGAAIEFDITSFSNLAILKGINITQITLGTSDYTFEIWEKDGTGYDPADYADHHLKNWARDSDQRVLSENIDQGRLYRDQDLTSKLHCRIVNNAGGTTSTFKVAVVAINGT